MDNAQCLIKLPHESSIRYYNGASFTFSDALIQSQIPSGLIFSDFESGQIYGINGPCDHIDLDSVMDEWSFCHFDPRYKQNGLSYRESLNLAIKELQREKFSKLVVSRIIPFDRPPDAFHVFKNLVQKNSQSTVYLLNHPHWGTWIGASPEQLISGHGQTFYTHALAGTRWHSSGAWSEKEYLEHNYVVRFISELALHMQLKCEKESLEHIIQGPLEHLLTRFTLSCSRDEALAFALAMHPTPAICGTPKPEAKKWIMETEKHHRELYTGLIGCVDATALHINVNLRCAKLSADAAYAYVGGGITAQSDPAKEEQETAIKSKIIAQAI